MFFSINFSGYGHYIFQIASGYPDGFSFTVFIPGGEIPVYKETDNKEYGQNNYLSNMFFDHINNLIEGGT